MKIRRSGPSDLESLIRINRDAFGQDEEAMLVRTLLDDTSAQPVLSLLAIRDELPVGHILFSRARLEPDDGRTAMLLAPMAMARAYQKQGIGSALVSTGLEMLAQSGTGLVFVLGHPSYYPRFGFIPAGAQGFEPPHRIPVEYADAWMVRLLRADAVSTDNARVVAADSIMDPAYWQA